MVIPILMHFCSLSSNWSVASHIKCDIINDFKLFPTVYCKILTLSNQTLCYKLKCIRIIVNQLLYAYQIYFLSIVGGNKVNGFSF